MAGKEYEKNNRTATGDERKTLIKRIAIVGLIFIFYQAVYWGSRDTRAESILLTAISYGLAAVGLFFLFKSKKFAAGSLIYWSLTAVVCVAVAPTYINNPGNDNPVFLYTFFILLCTTLLGLSSPILTAIIRLTDEPYWVYSDWSLYVNIGIAVIFVVISALALKKHSLAKTTNSGENAPPEETGI